MANTSDAEHSEQDDSSEVRPGLWEANRMTDDTVRRGRKWQQDLENMKADRAEKGTYPHEFTFTEDRGQYNKNVDKIAAHVSGQARDRPDNEGPLVVLVGGGGAAGKSTFFHELQGLLKKRYLASGQTEEKLELDHYFYPEEVISNTVADGKYDNPVNSDLARARKNIEALSGREETVIPRHDRTSHKRRNQAVESDENVEDLRMAKVLIVEGLYTLGPDLRALGKVAIYIDAAPVDRGKGRIWRDINVRGRSEEHVIDMLLAREQYHRTFVEPTQMVADFILRRPHTDGHLAVVEEKELFRCFKEAYGEVELDENKRDTLWGNFVEKYQAYLDEKGEEAAETGFVEVVRTGLFGVKPQN